MARTADSNYNAEAIEVLTGLEPVRKRPGMYTETTRPNHLAQEVIDNSVDEAIAGHADSINVVLYKDGSLEVEDNGRGMPVDIHPVHKVPGVELILTRLHSGAKFSNKSYKFSGGLHGVGVSVVNALSKRLDVSIKRDGIAYHMSFADGAVSDKLKKVGKSTKKESGTKIRFHPDPKYFDSSNFLKSRLTSLLKAKAVLCPGLKVNFIEEATDQQQTWYYEDGLKDYLIEQVPVQEYLPKDVFTGEICDVEQEVNWALVWADTDNNDNVQDSYVNLIPTPMGGTHVNGFRTGLLDAIREFCEIHALLPRGIKLISDDIVADLHFILSVKLSDAQFAGQTKERLSSRQCAGFVANVLKNAFTLWLNKHINEAKQIAELIIERAQTRQKAAKVITRKKVVSGPALPGKLADCTLQDPAHTELFLVEGDSAGGSAKQARNREMQAVMPLRGKILNTWEVDMHELLRSKEVHDIVVAIGVEPGQEDLSSLRYGKICILADADSDGLHIATLLCALFVKHFRPLVSAGHVFVAMPPLFRIDVGKQVHYALDEEEKGAILAKIKSDKPQAKPSIIRFKGLGEMSALQLRETTMAQDTRRLIQLDLTDDGQTDMILDMLLSKKRALDRRTWLETKGDLATI